MNILAVRRDGTLPHMLVYLEDIPSDVCLRLSLMTTGGKSGFADQVTEIVFQLPNGAGFTSASLPPAAYPLPITPDKLAVAGHCGPAGGRLKVISWIPLQERGLLAGGRLRLDRGHGLGLRLARAGGPQGGGADAALDRLHVIHDRMARGRLAFGEIIVGHWGCLSWRGTMVPFALTWTFRCPGTRRTR